MNKREKVLVVILVAAVILLGGFKFLIEPAITRLADKKEQLSAIQQTKDAVELDIARASQIDQSNSILESQIAETVKPFFPELKNDILQQYFKQLADPIGIRYDSFVMQAPVVTQIKNQVAENAEIDYPAKQAAEQIAGIENGSSAQSSNSQSASSTSAQAASSAKSPIQSPDVVEMMSITLQFQGSYEQSIAVLNAIKNSNRIMRVISFDITSSDAKRVTTITIECYGVAKFTSGDALSDSTLASPAGKANPFS